MVLFSSVFPWLKKNTLWTPLELKPYFQKGEERYGIWDENVSTWHGQ